MTRHVRLREFLVGVEGLALFRNLVEGDDAAADARIDEVRRIVGSEEEATYSLGIDIPELDARAGYARWSETYDEPGNPLIMVEEPVVHGLLAEAPPGRALDAACGTGRHARFLAERGHVVVGVDGAPEMLARAAAAVPTGSFIEGGLEQLPLRSTGLDLAVCALALGHLVELGPAIAELARVVRSGGRVVLADLHPTMSATGGQALFRAADGTSAFVREHPHLHSEYLAAFAASGLEIRRCLEPRFDESAAVMQGPAHHFVPEATIAAFRGLPGALVWDLVRR
jgi:SAM-dependent methyltransferase